MRYRAKAIEFVDADQWNKNGDLPDDLNGPHLEGEVVRYYRRPNHDGRAVHERCGRVWDDHGWIEPTKVLGQRHWNDGETVCPGDYVVDTGYWDAGRKQYKLIPRRLFEHRYEPDEEEAHAPSAAG